MGTARFDVTRGDASHPPPWLGSGSGVGSRQVCVIKKFSFRELALTLTCLAHRPFSEPVFNLFRLGFLGKYLLPTS